MKKIVIASAKAMGVLMLILIISSKVQAQPNPGPGNQGSTVTATSDGPMVPFDGGLSLMLAASGIGYVSNKLKKNK